VGDTTKQLSGERLLADYRLMREIRLHEEAVKRLFQQGRVPGSVHLCIGQEAVAAGVTGQLRDDDYIANHHRGHGHILAKGGELRPMLAEIMGKATGYCKGKGGSPHIASVELGNLGANGIVGGGIPLAVGAAISIQMNGTDQVSVAAFGDGASSGGNAHESMNLAALWGLPVLFLCENNQYAVSTHCSRAIAGGSVASRAQGYGMPSYVVDGNDLEAVHFAAAEALERVRSGAGPYLLECKTYRIEGHYVGDATVYREDDEVDAWIEQDPIQRVRRRLLEREVLSEEVLRAFDAEIEATIEEAVAFALESPEPDLESIYDDVYTDPAP